MNEYNHTVTAALSTVHNAFSVLMLHCFKLQFWGVTMGVACNSGQGQGCDYYNPLLKVALGDPLKSCQW